MVAGDDPGRFAGLEDRPEVREPAQQVRGRAAPAERAHEVQRRRRHAAQQRAAERLTCEPVVRDGLLVDVDEDAGEPHVLDHPRRADDGQPGEVHARQEREVRAGVVVAAQHRRGEHTAHDGAHLHEVRRRAVVDDDDGIAGLQDHGVQRTQQVVALFVVGDDQADRRRFCGVGCHHWACR